VVKKNLKPALGRIQNPTGRRREKDCVRNGGGRQYYYYSNAGSSWWRGEGRPQIVTEAFDPKIPGLVGLDRMNLFRGGNET